MRPVETSNDLLRTNMIAKNVVRKRVGLSRVGGWRGRKVHKLPAWYTTGGGELACHAGAELNNLPLLSLSLSLPHAKKQAPHRVKSQVTDLQSSVQIFGQIHKNWTHPWFLQKFLGIERKFKRWKAFLAGMRWIWLHEMSYLSLIKRVVGRISGIKIQFNIFSVLQLSAICPFDHGQHRGGARPTSGLHSSSHTAESCATKAVKCHSRSRFTIGRENGNVCESMGKGWDITFFLYYACKRNIRKKRSLNLS